LRTPGLKVLLGPISSAQVMRVAPLAQAAGVLELTASATSPVLSTLQRPAERMLFRTTPSEALQTHVLARLARGEPASAAGGAHCERIAIVGTDDEYGHAFADLFRRDVEGAGGRVVATQFVPAAAQIDYAGELRAVARARADCEVLCVGPK